MEGRKRNRMLGFDYSSEAIYFITICTKDKIDHFGKIQNGKMNLKEEGKIAEEQILWLKKQYSYFELHNFVIMPNHVHLLFAINGDSKFDNSVEIPAKFPTGHHLCLQSQSKIKSVSSLIGAFKTTVSKRIHEFGNFDFFWQQSFHDHIVRTQERYQQIANYIIYNPENWNKDKFYE